MEGGGHIYIYACKIVSPYKNCAQVLAKGIYILLSSNYATKSSPHVDPCRYTFGILHYITPWVCTIINLRGNKKNNIQPQKEWWVREETLKNKLLGNIGYIKEIIYYHWQPYNHTQARENYSLFFEACKGCLVIDNDYGLCP